MNKRASQTPLPFMGFGTAAIDGWQSDSQKVTDVVTSAIKAGYQYIDTASIYGNERSIGKAISESGVDRESLFIVSKAWNNEQGYLEIKQAFARSLERLGVNYLDAYLLHSPIPAKSFGSWKALEELVAEGKVRNIGLSNFQIKDLERLLPHTTIKPICNQIELHPYFTQDALREYCNEHGIQVLAWAPLGICNQIALDPYFTQDALREYCGDSSNVPINNKPIQDPIILAIANELNVSAAQVILRWHYQQTIIPISKSETPEHIKKNIDILSFSLSESQMRMISDLNQNKRFGPDPVNAQKEYKDTVPPN